MKPQMNAKMNRPQMDANERESMNIVEGKLLVELKCVASFNDEHMAQTLNYLRATELKIALLVNFQNPKVEWKRVVRNF